MPVIAPQAGIGPYEYRVHSTQWVGAAFIRVALHIKGAHLPILVGTLAFQMVFRRGQGYLIALLSVTCNRAAPACDWQLRCFQQIVSYEAANGLYQGTTLVVPNRVQKELGFSPWIRKASSIRG